MKRGPLYPIQAGVAATFVESDGWEVPAAFRSPEDELAVLRGTVGLADLTGWGLLRLRGSSRLGFVQRMSTNDVQRLVPGQGAPTVFTTPIGRIVDLAYVLVREADLLVLVSRGADQKVAGWLQRHIFFGDDVVIENLTESWALLGWTGPHAAQLLTQLLGRQVADIERYHALSGRIGSVAVTVIRAVPLGNDYLLLTEADQASSLYTALSTAVELTAGAPAGELALEAARIGAGWPRYGRELTEDFIPLEAGLKWAVSFNKGCYVGQEIIARMETYQRLAKRLAVLDCSLEAGAAGVGMASGDVLHAGDAQVDHVTSVAPLIDQGVIKALAYVKTPLAAAGNEVQVISRGGSCAATLSAVVGEGL